MDVWATVPSSLPLRGILDKSHLSGSQVLHGYNWSQLVSSQCFNVRVPVGFGPSDGARQGRDTRVQEQEAEKGGLWSHAGTCRRIIGIKSNQALHFFTKSLQLKGHTQDWKTWLEF